MEWCKQLDAGILPQQLVKHVVAGESSQAEGPLSMQRQQQQHQGIEENLQSNFSYHPPSVLLTVSSSSSSSSSETSDASPHSVYHSDRYSNLSTVTGGFSPSSSYTLTSPSRLLPSSPARMSLPSSDYSLSHPSTTISPSKTDSRLAFHTSTVPHSASGEGGHYQTPFLCQKAGSQEQSASLMSEMSGIQRASNWILTSMNSQTAGGQPASSQRSLSSTNIHGLSSIGSATQDVSSLPKTLSLHHSPGSFLPGFSRLMGQPLKLSGNNSQAPGPSETQHSVPEFSSSRVSDQSGLILPASKAGPSGEPIAKFEGRESIPMLDTVSRPAFLDSVQTCMSLPVISHDSFSMGTELTASISEPIPHWYSFLDNLESATMSSRQGVLSGSGTPSSSVSRSSNATPNRTGTPTYTCSPAPLTSHALQQEETTNLEANIPTVISELMRHGSP